MKSYEEKEYELSMLQKLRYPELRPMTKEAKKWKDEIDRETDMNRCLDDTNKLRMCAYGCLPLILILIIAIAGIALFMGPN